MNIFTEYIEGEKASIQFISNKNELKLISICEQVFQKRHILYRSLNFTQRLDK